MAARIFIVIFLSVVEACGQSLEEKFKYSTNYPEQNQQINFFYTGATAAGTVTAKIFFAGMNPPRSNSWVDIFPMVTDITLQDNGGVLQGTVTVPLKATAILTVLMDSLGNVVDNNNGQGYSMPVYSEGKPLPGALAGIAEFYSGYWLAETFYVKALKDVARNLYETDFARHPEIKKYFLSQYLQALNLANDSDKKLYGKELNEFAARTDLDEWDLLHIRDAFTLLGDRETSKKYGDKVLETFPDGSWSRQQKTIPAAMRIMAEKNYEKKKSMYVEFKSHYLGNYPDDFTKIILVSQMFWILEEMIPSMLNNNEMYLWQNEVDSLHGVFKFYAYQTAARYLNEHQRGDLKLKNPDGGLKIESPFQTYLVSQDAEVLATSEKFARIAIDWWRNNLDAPRRWNNQSYYTEKQLYRQRNTTLGETLDILGQTLILENKLNEASTVLKEAVALTQRKKGNINEHYIEALVKTNQMEQAVAEAEAAVKSGSSTAKINNFLKELSGDATLQDEAMIQLKNELKKLMISENTPAYTLVDINKQAVSLRHLKNKIVVIDFWATWCPPCIGTLESLNEVTKIFANDPEVVFLFINTEMITDKSINRTKKVLEAYAFQSYFDPDFKATFSFGVSSLPTKIVIDKSGRIRFHDIGLRGDKQQQIDRTIAMIQMLK